MLINIEGTDGSGKQTQAEMLYHHLKQSGKKCRLITFPDYNSESSALIKMYLSGKFGSDPQSVSPKVASIFYACDRYASFQTQWKQSYDNNEIIIADRYTSSNIIHQGAKILDPAKRSEFINWLNELEYNVFSIPKPDIIIYLNMPSAVSRMLIDKRASEASTNKNVDIHEASHSHLQRATDIALDISSSMGWCQIDCVDSKNRLKSVDSIHREILSLLDGKL